MISLQKIITKLKSLIDKNTADITALNSGLNRFKYMHYEQTFSNALYAKVAPPTAEYWPAAATAEWNDLERRVRSVSWQIGINKAVVWFDDFVTGKIGFDVLWIKNYD